MKNDFSFLNNNLHLVFLQQDLKIDNLKSYDIEYTTLICELLDQFFKRQAISNSHVCTYEYVCVTFSLYGSLLGVTVDFLKNKFFSLQFSNQFCDANVYFLMPLQSIKFALLFVNFSAQLASNNQNVDNKDFVVKLQVLQNVIILFELSRLDSNID